MKKFLLVTGTALLLLIVSLAGTLVFFRLPITAFVMTRALQRAGMTNIVFIPSEINGHGLVVDRFSCTLPGSGSRLVAGGLRINWNQSIIRSRRIDTVFIKALNIRLARGRPQPSRVSLQQLLDTIVRKLRQIRPLSVADLLPLQHLHVEKLILTGKGAGVLRGRELSLDLYKPAWLDQISRPQQTMKTPRSGMGRPRHERFSDKPAWLDQIGRPQQTMKTPDFGMGKPLLPGFSDKKNNNLTARILLPGAHLQLQATTSDSSTMVVQLGKTGQQIPFARVELTIHQRNIAARLKVDLAQLSLVNPLLAADLPKMRGKLSSSMALSWRKNPQVDGEVRLSGFTLSGTSIKTATMILHGLLEPTKGIVFHGKATLKDITPGPAGLRIGAIHVVCKNGLLFARQGRLQGKAGITAAIHNISTPQLHCGSVTLPLIALSSITDNGIIVRFKAQQPLKVAGLTSNKYTLAHMRLIPEQDTAITVAPKLSWSVSPGRWQITADPIKLQDFVVDPDPLTFKLQQFGGTGKRWHIRTTLSCPGVHLRAGKRASTITGIALRLRGDGSKIFGNGSWSLKPVPGLFALQFSHNLKTGKGSAVVVTDKPLTFSKEMPLSMAVTGWSLPADLTRGELRIKSSIRWPHLRMTGSISLNRGKGFFQDIRFSGLSFRQNLQILPVLRSRKTGTLTIETVDVGLPIHNFSTEMLFKPSGKPLPVLILKNTRASLLGGSVSNDYIQLDPQRPTFKTTIQVNNLNLADLLALQQVKGLKVSGSVSGELPIRLDKEGLHVDHGSLHNEQAGGIIEYTPESKDGLANSPLAGYALKALEEFHYNLLVASANYSPDGTLEVKLHLEGKSPRLDTKRPVHLNITTQQNLLSLIKSLRYSDALTNEIDREVQHHFQKR